MVKKILLLSGLCLSSLLSASDPEKKQNVKEKYPVLRELLSRIKNEKASLKEMQFVRDMLQASDDAPDTASLSIQSQLYQQESSAADPESIIMNNVENLRGLLSGLRYSSDLSLERKIKTDFDTACADLEQLKNNNKISEANYNTHHTWLHKEFLPAFKSLSTKSN